jgi:hypothetical protein
MPIDDTSIDEVRLRLSALVAGHFELGELLGAGGFAVVFRARDTLLDRDVAIKVLNPALSLDPSAAEQLLGEARLVASIEHPHIVPLYEAGYQDGIVFLVMRYYPDGTAASLISREHRLAPKEVARLGLEVADALAAAHARGVIHLDIKPDNILLDSKRHAAVADFGIARVMATTGAATQGVSSGTPQYMSPEQVAGDELDGRADVYALGLVLYELATGQRPIGGSSARQVMANQVRQVPTPISEVVPEIPTALGEIITRALAKDPAQRWASAQAMTDALRAASLPEKMVAPKVARKRTRRRWYSRGAMVGCGLLVGLVLIGYAVVKLIRVFNRGEPPAVDALAPLLPAPLVDSALTMGTLSDRDSVVYIFIPHGKGVKDAFFITTRDIIAVVRGQTRRYPIAEDYNIDIRRTGSDGLLLVKLRSKRVSDTVYTGMTGMEQQIIGLSLRRAFAQLPKQAQ